MRRSPRLPLEALAPYLLPAQESGVRSQESGVRGQGSGVRSQESGVRGQGSGVRDEAATPLDWRTVFGNDRPVEIEVGFGKGLFLVTSAEARPDVNFLGIEIVRKYQLFTATRLARRGLGNVRVVCADARLFLRDRVAAGSIQGMHVYFPDPWWKKRHHKRRVFTPEFVAECARVLHAGGRLSVATDVQEYASFIAGLIAARPDLRPLPPPEPSEAVHDLDYLTNFERKFRKQGKAIVRMLWEKGEAPTG